MGAALIKQGRIGIEDIEGVRLSRHVMLSDILFNAHIAYTQNAGPSQATRIFEPERMAEARHLCNNLIEPLIEMFGPCSFAAGFAATAKGPHSFTARDGAAVDAVFHRVVEPTPDNPEGAAPSTMLRPIKKTNLPFHRLIFYAGTEFACFAASSRFQSFRCYENIRIGSYDPATGPQGMKKPAFLTHSTSPSQWRSLPMDALPAERKGWRRDSLEPVFHTRRSIRPQHIRVGRFFTFLDMMTNSWALSNECWNLLPVVRSKQVRVARMAAQLLDPVVEAFGRVSILRGAETAEVNNARAAGGDPDAALYRWTGDHHRIEFTVPDGVDHFEVMAVLESIAKGADRAVTGYGSLRNLPTGEPVMAVEFVDFKPRKTFTSARVEAA